MAPKLCIRCKGTGQRFDGTCFRCAGKGVEPAQAKSSIPAEELLFDGTSDETSSSLVPGGSPIGGSDAVLKLTGRLDAAIQQIGSNHVTAITSLAKLKSPPNSATSASTTPAQSHPWKRRSTPSLAH
jgi:DnaJ-class molecular chaperone